VEKKFTLGKEERLKSRKQTDKLFAEGQKFSSGFFRVYYLFDAGSGPAIQFGTGVSNKNFKKAVDRNRIKRLTREAWRTQKNELKANLSLSGRRMNIFFIYTAKTIPVYNEVMVTVKKIITRLDKTIAAFH